MQSSNIFKLVLKNVLVIFGFAALVSFLAAWLLFKDFLMFHEMIFIFTFIYLIIGIGSFQRKQKYKIVMQKYNDKERVKGFDVAKNKITSYAFFISSLLTLIAYLVIEIIAY